MSTTITAHSPTTALAALAARADADPEEPWLFYRRGWDWHWRSWGQVADHVARGGDALADADRTVDCSSTQDPDALTLSLAVQAAGGTCQLSSRPTDTSQKLPACHSRLEHWQPRSLNLDIDGGSFLFADDPAEIAPSEIFAAAQTLDRRLADPKDRWILCATPAITPRDLQIALAWTLLAGAAWVLEPDIPAFHETLLWARPSLVIATTAEIDRLNESLKKRQNRRHSRIQATVDLEKAPLDSPPDRPDDR